MGDIQTFPWTLTPLDPVWPILDPDNSKSKAEESLTEENWLIWENAKQSSSRSTANDKVNAQRVR